jgi:hypothetical protein
LRQPLMGVRIHDLVMEGIEAALRQRGYPWASMINLRCKKS